MSSCYSQCTAVKSHRKQRDTIVTPLCDNFIVNIKKKKTEILSIGLIRPL